MKSQMSSGNPYTCFDETNRFRSNEEREREKDQIDAKTQEIKPSSDETFSDMLELADELPDSSPRFVLLSYPLTLVRFPSL